MNTSLRRLPLCIALAALFSAAVPAFAQDAGSDTEIVAEATVSRDRLVDRYAEAAGSEDLAAGLIDGLRKGGEFTVQEAVTTTTTNADGTTTTTTTMVDRTVANPAGPMGWGEVNISLSLAQALVGAGTYASLSTALAGVPTTVTNADGTTTTTVEGGVLSMCADGMGWGAIAKELGFNLGSLISASNKSERAVAAADKKAERTAKAEKAEKAAKPEKAERAAKAERPDRVAKVDRPERPTRPERIERPQRPERPERGGRP